MIVGNDSGENDRSVEIIDIFEEKHCDVFEPFPLPIFGAFGAIVNQKPIICGGYVKNTLSVSYGKIGTIGYFKIQKLGFF